MKILLLIIIIILSFSLTSSLPIPDPYRCVQLTWHRNMICEWGFGHFTSYTAGVQNIVIAGDIVPHNNQWDGKYFSLSGRLVNNGSCTILDVTKALSCTPSVDINK